MGRVRPFFPRFMHAVHLFGNPFLRRREKILITGKKTKPLFNDAAM